MGWFGGITGLFSRSVASDEIDDLFVDYVDPAWLEDRAPPPLLLDDDDDDDDDLRSTTTSCPGWSSFNVFTSSVQPHVFQQVKQRWQSLEEDSGSSSSSSSGREVIMSSLNSAGHRDDVIICGILSTTIKMWVVPSSLDKSATYDTSGSSGIGPTITVTQPGHAMPSTTLLHHHPYTLTIANFPPGTTITVRLMGNKMDPFDNSSPPLTKFVNFADEGVEEQEWVVSEDIPSGQYYYFKATTPQGNTAYSPLVEVVNPKQSYIRRRILI